MSLTKAVMLGGTGAIAIPFAIGGSDAPVARLVAMVRIAGPSGATIPWSWPVFCLVTLVTWALLRAAGD